MRDNYVKIPFLQQREIEIKVLAPLIRAFSAEFGEDRTREVVRRVMRGLALEAGRAAAAEFGSGLDSFKKNCVGAWQEGGALASETREDSDDTLRFDVTRCDFANVYRELGFGDIGALVSCERDVPFTEGFDPAIEFTRSKTLMAGDDRCDFCYKVKKQQ